MFREERGERILRSTAMTWREGGKLHGAGGNPSTGSAVKERKGQVSEVGVRREEQREFLYGVVIIKTLAGP